MWEAARKEQEKKRRQDIEAKLCTQIADNALGDKQVVYIEADVSIREMYFG